MNTALIYWMTTVFLLFSEITFPKFNIFDYKGEDNRISSKFSLESFEHDTDLLVTLEDQNSVFPFYTSLSKCGICKVDDLSWHATEQKGAETHKIIRCNISSNCKVHRNTNDWEFWHDISYIEKDGYEKNAVCESQTFSLTTTSYTSHVLEAQNYVQAFEAASNIGDDQISIGILDSGISAAHPRLSAVVNYNYSQDFTYERGMTTDSSLTDSFGHGTEVAGIIGASQGEDIIFKGVCRNANLISLKVIDSNGGISYSSLISAIQYANRIGLKTLNISAGITTDVYALKCAIQDFDGVIVCACGNAGTNLDNANNPVYPACYNYLDNVISVEAYSSCILNVDTNLFADCSCFSYTDWQNGEEKKRYISYAKEVDDSSTIKNRIVQAFFDDCLELIGKNSDEWIFRITNLSQWTIVVDYNKKMANATAAKNWTSSLRDVHSFSLEHGKTKAFNIKENFLATYAAISYKINGIGNRYIRSATDLSISTTFTLYEGRTSN